MEFESSPPPPISNERRFNTKLGLVLFFVYLLLYLVFVLISALATDVMDITIVAGLNLAMVYGFGLIFTALVLALIYGLLCKTEPAEPSGETRNPDGAKTDGANNDGAKTDRASEAKGGQQ